MGDFHSEYSGLLDMIDRKSVQKDLMMPGLTWGRIEKMNVSENGNERTVISWKRLFHAWKILSRQQCQTI